MSTTTITDQVKINAPREKVWTILADLGAVQEFHPAVKKSYYISEDREGLGAARRCEFTPFGSIDETVIDWKEGEILTLNIHNGKKQPPFKDFTASQVLKSVGDGTVVSLKMEYKMKYGLLGSLMNNIIVKRQMTKVAGAMLRELKVYSEKIASQNESPVSVFN